MKILLNKFEKIPRIQVNTKNNYNCSNKQKTENLLYIDNPIKTAPIHYYPVFGSNIQLQKVQNVNSQIIKKILVTDKLSKIIDDKHKKIFDNDHLNYILSKMNDYNMDILISMADMKTEKGCPVFGPRWFSLIAENIQSITEKIIAKNLLKIGKLPNEFVGIFDIYKKQKPSELSSKVLNLLIKEKDALGNDKFGALCIADIMKCIKNEDDYHKLLSLLSDKKIETFDIIKYFKTGEKPEICDFNKRPYGHDFLLNRGLNFFNIDPSEENLVNNLFDSMNKHPKIAQRIINILKQGRSERVNLNFKSFNSNSIISDNVLSDIENFVINKKPYVKEFYMGTPIQKLLQETSNGEAVQVGKKLYVNDNGVLINLNITKEKYIELFPPIKRFNFCQGNLGDCWLISALDVMMNSPSGRVNIYRLFRQEGNDIYIKFPNGEHEIKFKDSKTLETNKNMDGPLGLQMIEQAFSFQKNKDYTNNTFEDILSTDNVNQQLNKLNTGYTEEAYKGLLSNIDIYNSCDLNLSIKKLMMALIKDNANSDNFINFGTSEPYAHSQAFLEKTYGLVEKHAYSIKGFDQEHGLLYITNPHNCGLITEIPIYELFKHVHLFSFKKIKYD